MIGSLSGTGSLSGALSATNTLSGSLSAEECLHGTLTLPRGTVINYYNGPYTFVPTESQQVIAINNQLAIQDITIAPIPPNYGRIAWDGSVLTVY